MSSELVAKYGGTLVGDTKINQGTHIATVSIGGYNLQIRYTACDDDMKSDAGMLDNISSYSIII